MTQSKERDYVLGTHDQELERLGVQHRAGRPVVLDCWKKAGVTVGSGVLDVGAGPGYATVDLAEIVGHIGRVVAVERSSNFVKAIKSAIQARSLPNVEVQELDVMNVCLLERTSALAWWRVVLSCVCLLID